MWTTLGIVVIVILVITSAITASTGTQITWTFAFVVGVIIGLLSGH